MEIFCLGRTISKYHPLVFKSDFLDIGLSLWNSRLEVRVPSIFNICGTRDTLFVVCLWVPSRSLLPRTRGSNWYSQPCAFKRRQLLRCDVFKEVQGEGLKLQITALFSHIGVPGHVLPNY